MSKPNEPDKNKKAWRPQIGPFIKADPTDTKPHRMFQAVSFTRNLLGEQTGQAACRIASNYLETDPGTLAYELGRAVTYGWSDSPMKEQFTNGLRDGLKAVQK